MLNEKRGNMITAKWAQINNIYNRSDCEVVVTHLFETSEGLQPDGWTSSFFVPKTIKKEMNLRKNQIVKLLIGKNWASEMWLIKKLMSRCGNKLFSKENVKSAEKFRLK